MLTLSPDRTNNPLIQQLTPQVAPAIQKVLGPPEEQLDQETRLQLTELVQYLSQKA
jgi:importin-4